MLREAMHPQGLVRNQGWQSISMHKAEVALRKAIEIQDLRAKITVRL